MIEQDNRIDPRIDEPSGEPLTCWRCDQLERGDNALILLTTSTPRRDVRGNLFFWDGLECLTCYQQERALVSFGDSVVRRLPHGYIPVAGVDKPDDVVVDAPPDSEAITCSRCEEVGRGATSSFILVPTALRHELHDLHETVHFKEALMCALCFRIDREEVIVEGNIIRSA